MMKFFITLISLATLALSYASPTNRVVGGEDAVAHEFPYQVSIQYNGIHNCGGSILNKYYVLTAAHCASPVNSTKVVAGGHNLKHLNGHEQVRDVERFILHEGYTSGVGPYDIALIKLAKPFVLNKYVKAISLPNQGDYPEGDAVISGWGSTSRDFFPEYPSVLQKALMPIHTEDECLALWQGSPFHTSNVCAGKLSGENSVCSGDSGGPLAQKLNGKSFVVGVVSWGKVPCGAANKPGVFTRVSYYIDWILDNMEN